MLRKCENAEAPSAEGVRMGLRRRRRKCKTTGHKREARKGSGDNIPRLGVWGDRSPPPPVADEGGRSIGNHKERPEDATMWVPRTEIPQRFLIAKLRVHRSHDRNHGDDHHNDDHLGSHEGTSFLQLALRAAGRSALPATGRAYRIRVGGWLKKCLRIMNFRSRRRRRSARSRPRARPRRAPSSSRASRTCPSARRRPPGTPCRWSARRFP